MNRWAFFCGVAMLLAFGTLSGCSSGAQVGRVVVEVRSMALGAQGTSYDVTVLGPDREVVAVREVFAGTAIAIVDVPFGWVSVGAAAMCTVEGELSRESSTMRLVLEEKNCTLND